MTLLGECTETDHPAELRRVSVRFANESGGESTLWLPLLHGLVVRKGDRVLLCCPLGAPEPVVVGVLDGFIARPEAPRTVAARMTLERDETLSIVNAEGQGLVEIVPSDAGPVVRILRRDLHVQMPGCLKFTAESIELTATRGEVQVTASDDVVVRGESIRLN